jgi:hypothetical protein
MFKTNIKNLFRDVASIPLETADPDLLAHISFGYRNLLIMAYTMPWVTETLGDEAAPQPLIARMLDASDRLASKLDQDMSVEDRARCIVYLLHTLIFHYNPDHIQVAKNAATEIMDAISAKEPNKYLSLADSPYLCKIRCYDYYFRTQKDSLKKAEDMLTQWQEQLQEEGSWQEVTEDVALQRLESFALYSDVADQHKFQTTVRKALTYYTEFPTIKDEVRLLFLLAQMGQFGNYPQQVEQIMNHVLEGTLSASASGSLSDAIRTKNPHMLKALRFHILALYMLNTEKE